VAYQEETTKMNMKIVAAFLALIIIGAAGVVGVWYLLAPKPNPYDFAIVFATGGLGDKSFNDGCKKGADDINAAYPDVTFTYSTPSAIAQYEPMLRAFASHSEWIEPYKIIISIGFDQADALMKVAGDYPNQNFAIVDMWINDTTYPKVASLLFNEHEGSALVGALAGLYTTTDKLGFVGGMSIPLIHKFGAGYYWGANLSKHSINIKPTGDPGPAVVKGYTNDWSNIAAGKALADIMYQTNGTDIIYAAAGRSGIGVINSAKENNATLGPIWAIGVDSPQMYLGCANPDSPAPPTVVLTSMLKRVDVAVYDIVKAACVTDTFAGGVYIFNLANNGVGWENNPTLKVIPPAYIAKLNMIATGIINGTYTVPQTYPWLL
jgi:basic membrane protein A